jgi:hypothetical protein
MSFATNGIIASQPGQILLQMPTKFSFPELEFPHLQ